MGKTAKTKSKVKVHRIMESRTDFFYYAFRNVLLVSIPLLIVSGIVLSHLSFHSSATGSSSGVDQIQFSLSSSCTMSSVVNEAHTKEINNGTYHSDVGKTTITTLCNDGNGYSVYATGYSNNEDGNTKLINAEHPEYSIDTGLATSGLISNWAMKLNNIPDDPSPTPPVIEPAYDNTYGLVPQYWTRVTSRPSGTTDMDEGSSFTTTYAIYTTSNQHAGAYNGQVKYVLTHPSIQPYVYYMQEVDKWKNMIALEESVQAIDMRDGKKYWVTKLKDGNIWMTQNLDLEIGGTNTAPLNSNNTDISTTASGSSIYTDGYTKQDGVWTWNPVSTAITSNYYISGTTVNPSAWPTNDYTTPYSAEGGDTYYYTSNTTADDTRFNSLQACKDASHTEDECKRYFAGNYYNWTAAIASNNSTNIGNTVGEIASNSICPKGWRLPNASQTDNVNNEFGRMLYREGITAALSNGNESVSYYNGVTSFNKLRSNPYYFVRSGGNDGGTLYNPGVFGYYWSSTVSSTYAYILYFSGTGIYPARTSYRHAGRSVRCVAR
jgi:uncharacterized protein (TIGR02145 family)